MATIPPVKGSCLHQIWQAFSLDIYVPAQTVRNKLADEAALLIDHHQFSANLSKLAKKGLVEKAPLESYVLAPSKDYLKKPEWRRCNPA